MGAIHCNGKSTELKLYTIKIQPQTDFEFSKKEFIHIDQDEKEVLQNWYSYLDHQQANDIHIKWIEDQGYTMVRVIPVQNKNFQNIGWNSPVFFVYNNDRDDNDSVWVLLIETVGCAMTPSDIRKHLGQLLTGYIPPDPVEPEDMDVDWHRYTRERSPPPPGEQLENVDKKPYVFTRPFPEQQQQLPAIFGIDQHKPEVAKSKTRLTTQTFPY